jgi:hypothetical protein
VGETHNQAFQFSFCSSLKVGFQGSQVTSDAGLLLVRELDERLGLGQFIHENLTDARRGKNTQLPMSDLLCQSIYTRLAGYEDLNDAERLRFSRSMDVEPEPLALSLGLRPAGGLRNKHAARD